MGEPILPLLDDPGKQIRLLKRRPGSEQDMKFDITVHHLDVLPQYLAISYTWGSPLDTASIYINGELFRVRQNCHHALWQVQLHFADAYFWVDSICIDQESVDEKNQQVQMMGHIYASADGVLACLGPHANGSEQLIQRRVTEEPAAYNLKDRAWMWKIVRAFWQRPYWKRLWIVQELELAKRITLLCGEHVVEFSDLSLMPWRSDWTDHIRGVPGFALQAIRGERSRADLWDTVLDNVNQQCADPRDHVYGILALYAADSTAPQHPIKVDYSISAPALALETIKRVRPVVSDMSRFGTQFLDILRALNVCSGTGLSAVDDFRKSVFDDTSKFTELGNHLLAACWDSLPMTKELPHMLQNLPRGHKAAAFDVNDAGHLSVRVFEQVNDLRPPALRKPKTQEKYFVPSPDPVTQVDFEAAIGGSVYTLTARVTSMSRPGDLLLRTGLHIYGDINRNFESVSGLRELHSFQVGGATTVELNHKDLESKSPEEFVVVRWMAPALWKVIGQAHITACGPAQNGEMSDPSQSCFFDDCTRPYQPMYSLTSPEAAFLQWTHCLALSRTPPERRTQLLDDIVSRPPPSSYFYMPRLKDDLIECRKNVEPDWEKKFCQRVPLRESQSEHVWFSKVGTTLAAWRMAKDWEERMSRRRTLKE